MRFKIDENLHDDVAALLTGAGHDAQTVHTEGLRGCDDATLAAHCLAEGRAIVTLDFILLTSAHSHQQPAQG